MNVYKMIIPLVCLLMITSCSKNKEKEQRKSHTPAEEVVATHIEALTSIMNDNMESPEDGVDQIIEYVEENGPDTLKILLQESINLSHTKKGKERRVRMKDIRETLQDPVNNFTQAMEKFAEIASNDPGAKKKAEKFISEWSDLGEGLQENVFKKILMANPQGKKQLTRSDIANTISNAKQIFLLMVEFDQDFGSFPSAAILADNPDLSPGTSGNHSNALLGQFIAGGYINSEEIFYAKGGSSSNKKPDNMITLGKILEAGECGFAYITNQSTSDDASRPILLAPMLGKNGKFDPKPYNGKAVILRIDGAVKTYQIDENGDVSIGGKNIFDPTNSIWGSKGFKKEDLVFPK